MQPSGDRGREPNLMPARQEGEDPGIGKVKTAVLGWVSTKSPLLESEDFKRRIEEAQSYVALESLGLSPQCGFASTIEGNPLTPDDQSASWRWWWRLPLRCGG